MSYRGSPTKGRSTKGRSGKLFSLTRWGVLFFFLSLAILLIGALRMELAAILWGSSFCLLAVYSLLANRLTQATLRRFFEKAPDPVDFTLSATGVFPRRPATAQLNAELPRLRAPGVKIRFEILLHWPGRKPLRLSKDLRAGRNHHVFEFFPPYRGCYQSREIHIVIGDLLGFTRLPLTLALAEKLRVYPAVQLEAARRPPSLEGGQEENRGSRRKRSEELLEVRKYFPGDDVRKVHWKVYAHTSQLFLRIGEEIPPPESRFLVILDSAPTPVVPGRIEADYLDALVQALAATVLEVLARGYRVYFTLCDSPQLKQFTLEKKLRLLADLAGVWWNDRYALELPLHHPYQILLFSSPGSANLPRIMNDLQKRGGEVKLFFPDPPAPFEQPHRNWFRKLVLRPPADQSRRLAVLGSGELHSYQITLEREIARWSRRGNWKVGVETI
jgi:uncharacterized protein (DUF58 family)